MTSSNTWLIPIAIALVSALFTYLGVARRTSGRIETSEASALWKEASDLREVYQDEIARLRAEIHQLRADIEILHRENADLKRQLRDLKNG